MRCGCGRCLEFGSSLCQSLSYFVSPAVHPRTCRGRAERAHTPERLCAAPRRCASGMNTQEEEGGGSGAVPQRGRLFKVDFHVTSSTARHTNCWAPQTRKRHQQEHRPQRPTESSDPTHHAKGRTGDCPGPRKETTTGRHVTRGGLGGSHRGAACSKLIFPQPTFASRFSLDGWVSEPKDPPSSYKQSPGTTDGAVSRAVSSRPFTSRPGNTERRKWHNGIALRSGTRGEGQQPLFTAQAIRFGMGPCFVFCQNLLTKIKCTRF